MDKKVKEQASEVDRRVGDKLKSVWESSAITEKGGISKN